MAKIWVEYPDDDPSFPNKVKSYFQSVMSKGLTGKKVDENVRHLRVLSCHGTTDGTIPPCEHLIESDNYPGKHYCSKCGCGDKSRSLLDKEGYNKLDYPVLSCPIGMPGFTNYEQNLANPRQILIEKHQKKDDKTT